MRLLEPLQGLCLAKNLLGTILIASEGVNGTLAGSQKNLEVVLEWLQQELSLIDSIDGRWSMSEKAPFRRMRVKIKREIVNLGRPDLYPDHLSGQYIDPKDWNKLLGDPDILILDTRNTYEVEIGTFKNAISPNTDSFREFPKYANELVKADRNKKVAMFCTGGIRCEKASILMKELGFKNVYQLRGGILNYLENISPDDSMWLGDCFVFDDRVTINQQLQEGNNYQCNACRRPLAKNDLSSSDYIKGISCPNCICPDE